MSKYNKEHRTLILSDIDHNERILHATVERWDTVSSELWDHQRNIISMKADVAALTTQINDLEQLQGEMHTDYRNTVARLEVLYDNLEGRTKDE